MYRRTSSRQQGLHILQGDDQFPEEEEEEAL